MKTEHSVFYRIFAKTSTFLNKMQNLPSLTLQCIDDTMVTEQGSKAEKDELVDCLPSHLHLYARSLAIRKMVLLLMNALFARLLPFSSFVLFLFGFVFCDGLSQRPTNVPSSFLSMKQFCFGPHKVAY
jgi:hypothetical protein